MILGLDGLDPQRVRRLMEAGRLPNLQRIRVKMPNGGTKRLLVSVKAIKAGLVQKA